MLKFVLLGLLEAEPRYGYELKAVFERFLGGTWPLNIAQVYTTLSRLEQDGLIEASIEPQRQAPDRKVFAITQPGRTELERWASQPERGPVRLRDELFLKIAVRSLTEGPRAAALIHIQRAAHLDALAEMSRLQHDPGLHPATALLLEGAMMRLEADLRWLELAESRMKTWSTTEGPQ